MQMCTNPHVGVDLFLQAPDLSQMLTYCFLKVQDTATLFLRIAGDLQLETHTLLPLTVLLYKAKNVANQQKRQNFIPKLVSRQLQPVPTLRRGSTWSSRLLTMSRIMEYCTGLVEISKSLWMRVKVSTAPVMKTPEENNNIAPTEQLTES